MKNVHAIILMGSPGSGKTSITRRLASHNKIEYVETGHLLREEIDKQ